MLIEIVVKSPFSCPALFNVFSSFLKKGTTTQQPAGTVHVRWSKISKHNDLYKTIKARVVQNKQLEAPCLIQAPC